MNGWIAWYEILIAVMIIVFGWFTTSLLIDISSKLEQIIKYIKKERRKGK